MNTKNSFNTIVNQKEAQALKDMIFKRATERVVSITEDTNASYTQAAQNDVMDMARDAFVGDIKNPFSQILADEYTKTQVKEAEIKEDTSITSKKNSVTERQNAYQDKINAENIVQMREDMLNSASREFPSANKGFIGALNFLNAQASVSLLKKQGKALDITV